MQNWPAKVVTPAASSGTVESSAASSNTIMGVFPPSSRFSRFNVLAPAAAICRPTGMLPVKLTMSTSADSTRNGERRSERTDEQRHRCVPGHDDRHDADRFGQAAEVLARRHL